MCRIVGKAVMFIIQPEVKRATGARQLCCGQQAGCEAAIHCMTEWFQRDENDGIILVDAQNAFNSLNREAALTNLRFFLSCSGHNRHKHLSAALQVVCGRWWDYTVM